MNVRLNKITAARMNAAHQAIEEKGMMGEVIVAIYIILLQTRENFLE